MAKKESTKAKREDTSDSNGGLIFELLDGDLSSIQRMGRRGSSPFVAAIEKVMADEIGPKGHYPVHVLFKKEVAIGDEDGALEVYTKAKQLKAAAKRLNANVTVASYTLPGTGEGGLPVRAVLAQRAATLEETEAAESTEAAE